MASRPAAATVDADAAPQAPSPALPTHARVVVIGGGVSGTSVAYHLAKLGWSDVVLLERRQLTAGSTWHAAGLITSAGVVHETLLWMARYTRDLCTTLEAETGQATGFRPIGHIHLACSPRRLEGLRRDFAFARGFGVEVEELGARELGELVPHARTDDILAGFYVADEGRANPADITQAYAKGARMHGARILEGVTAAGVTQDRGRVTGVVTDQGTIACEYVVNAAGIWARELGALAGVNVPLQAAEHYYMITDAVPWIDPDMPVIEDPDNYGYYREEGGGMLVGLFEPGAAAWSLDRIPEEIAFASLPPDWERVGPWIERAMRRFPELGDVRVRQLFCGPESFTADNGPFLGEAPELRNYFVATGMNSLGILFSGGTGSLIAQWIVDGVAPADVTFLTPDRAQPFLGTRRFRRDRAPALLATLFGDSVWPNWHHDTARNVRRSPLHDRLAAAGAHFADSSGWEYPEWFAPAAEQPEIIHGFGRDASFPLQAAEHRAVREAVGLLDMSLLAKVLVQGRDAEAVLNRICANDIAVEPGRIVYTPWLNERGGFEADLTVTRIAEDRFVLNANDYLQHRLTSWVARHTPTDAHVALTDVTSGYAVLQVQGPRSRELLSRCTTADLSNEAFPYLAAREIEIGYAVVLAIRVTYVGELGWELHVPTEFAVHVHDTLVEAGTDLGIRHVGMGALESLRLEKGYRDFGVDIDTTDTPIDAGLEFVVAWDKPGGFIGRDALVAQRDREPVPRRRLAQFLLADPEPILHRNEPILRDGRWVGYVRAGAFGHTLGASVGLGMVEDEAGLPRAAIADGRFEIEIAGTRWPASAALRPLYDPTRARIKA